MEISGRLEPGAVSVSIRGESVNDVIEELVELLRSTDGTLDKAEIKENLIKREELLSTAMGSGIAFPHCTSAGISSPRFALGVSSRGIDADAPDSKPVHIFFCVISPEKDPNAHLEALAAASRLFIDPHIRQVIKGARGPEEVIEAIASVEKKRGQDG